MKSEVVREKSPSSGELLELDLGAGRFELLLDFLGFGLGSVLLDRLGRTFDQVLRFLEAQAGDGADFLDDANLVGARLFEDDGELGLGLSGGSGGSGRTACGGGGDGSGGRDAPLALEVFDERGEIDDRLARKPLDDLFLGDVAHDDCSLDELAVSKSETRLRDVSPSLPRWIFLAAGAGPPRECRGTKPLLQNCFDLGLIQAAGAAGWSFLTLASRTRTNAAALLVRRPRNWARSASKDGSSAIFFRSSAETIFFSITPILISS